MEPTLLHRVAFPDDFPKQRKIQTKAALVYRPQSNQVVPNQMLHPQNGSRLRPTDQHTQLSLSVIVFQQMSDGDLGLGSGWGVNFSQMNLANTSQIHQLIPLEVGAWSVSFCPRARLLRLTPRLPVAELSHGHRHLKGNSTAMTRLWRTTISANDKANSVFPLVSLFENPENRVPTTKDAYWCDF